MMLGTHIAGEKRWQEAVSELHVDIRACVHPHMWIDTDQWIKKCTWKALKLRLFKCDLISYNFGYNRKRAHASPQCRTWMWGTDGAVPAVWGTLAPSSTILVYWVVSFGNTSYKNSHKQDLIMLMALSQHVSWADVNCEAAVPSFLIRPVTDSQGPLRKASLFLQASMAGEHPASTGNPTDLWAPW